MGSASIVLQSSIMLVKDSPAVCVPLAASTHFWYSQAVLWISCIAHDIFCSTQVTSVRKRQYVYLALCWTIPIIYVGGLLIGKQYGEDNGTVWGRTCWLTNPLTSVAQASWVALLIICFLFNIICFVLLLKTLYSLKAPTAVTRDVMWQTAKYVFVFMVCWFPQILAQILSWAGNGKTHSGAFGVFESIFQWGVMIFPGLQGFFNMFVYGLNPRIIRAYARLFGCIPKKRLLDTDTSDATSINSRSPTDFKG